MCIASYSYLHHTLRTNVQEKILNFQHTAPLYYRRVNKQFLDENWRPCYSFTIIWTRNAQRQWRHDALILSSWIIHCLLSRSNTKQRKVNIVTPHASLMHSFNCSAYSWLLAANLVPARLMFVQSRCRNLNRQIVIEWKVVKNLCFLF